MSKKIAKALSFAYEAHEGQTRKDGVTPYIIHPLDVYKLLVQHRVEDEDILCAALLHDTVEDTPVNLHQIVEEFGGQVGQIVRVVSEGDFTPGQPKPPKAKRREVYLENFKLEMEKHQSFTSSVAEEAALVAIADKICNIRDWAKPHPIEYWARYKPTQSECDRAQFLNQFGAFYAIPLTEGYPSLQQAWLESLGMALTMWSDFKNL